MRTILRLGIILLALACGFVFSGALQAAEVSVPAPADGKALFDYVTKVSPYVEWDLLPGTTQFREGKEPHGTLQNVYVNPIAAKAIQQKAAIMPEGAVILKESYTRDKELVNVTVMAKKTGFDSVNGDYIWLKFDQERNIVAEGKLAPCISCHAGAKATDRVFLLPK